MSLPVTEDTPPDMLAGSMDLKVVLPDGRSVKMSVQRGTPMMDLLVQVTTAHCLSPGDFSLQAMGDRGVLPFKPSTPIGALDTFTVKIVEKKLHSRGRAPQVPQSFLNTFRLQVHLPRSQLFVLRVTPEVSLSEIMTHICTEKNLNADKYEFRNPVGIGLVLKFYKKVGRRHCAIVPHAGPALASLQSRGYTDVENELLSETEQPLSSVMLKWKWVKNENENDKGNLDEVLELEKTLGDYKLQELSLMSKGNRTVSGLMSSADIINVKSSKQRQNSVCDSSLSSGSFGSRSGSPVPPITVVTMPPQPPLRKKRRPAPKPPTFTDTEKKDQTTGSVLISHSRESSDSSGYHEASVLSESPTHGRLDSDSPPDTLPRRSKLPPSQSFTNLSSIQPPPKARLTNSVSNTSLNSNGLYRKKRAPPPPPTTSQKSQQQLQQREEGRVKASTLPTSAAEERRAAASASASSSTSVSVSFDKVQSPVDAHQTKASRVEIEANGPTRLDVDVRLPPKPKPRTLMPKTPPKCSEQTRQTEGNMNRWRNVENLSEEEDKKTEEEEKMKKDIKEKKMEEEKGERNGLLPKTSEPSRAEAPPETPREADDHDSIDWEYQLPPPPTDFRDAHSPSCTDAGTVTIHPEILEGVVVDGDLERKTKVETETVTVTEPKPEPEPEVKAAQWKCSDNKFSQNKSVVMSELTNILNSKQKLKEKSLSVSNLYIADCLDNRKNALNYSRSFSTEPGATEVFRLTTYQGLGNNKLSTSTEHIHDSNITYRNNRNLEKSSSMECMQLQSHDGRRIIENNNEEVFRKPVAPVQKKLKVAKRSASSVGTPKRSSLESSKGEWEDEENIHILREQFLEFLKEKKLNTELNMKSLDVIRNILPELSQKNKEEEKNVRVSLVINQSNETHSQERKKEEKEKKEKEEAKKRYSYQGPPSINFGTWGERPKTTKIIIKDEDYVTKVTEKKSEPLQVVQKPKEVVKKPPQIVIKKPGVLSRYEMFSALPRRKEITSLQLVHMEDEEKNKSKATSATDANRVPIVCGMELKKEFKSSVYVNGTSEKDRTVEQIIPKRNAILMPVVKGFRPLEEKVSSGAGEETAGGAASVSVVKLKPASAFVKPTPTATDSKIEKKLCLRVNESEGGAAGAGWANSRPASSAVVVKQKKQTSTDPRSDLLEEIRNFGGFRKMKRATAH